MRLGRWRSADTLQLGDLVEAYGLKGVPMCVESIERPDDYHDLVTMRDADGCPTDIYTPCGSRSFRRVAATRLGFYKGIEAHA